MYSRYCILTYLLLEIYYRFWILRCKLCLIALSIRNYENRLKYFLLLFFLLLIFSYLSEKSNITSHMLLIWSCQSQLYITVTNFIQLVSPQLVDQFSQTKLRWEAPNEGYLYMCGIHKSDNKWLRYQAINSYKSFVC